MFRVAKNMIAFKSQMSMNGQDDVVEMLHIPRGEKDNKITMKDIDNYLE